MATLAVAFASQTQLTLAKSHNEVNIAGARLQAESGVAFISYTLRQLALPRNTTGQALLNAIGTALASRLNGSANLGGHTVLTTTGAITVPFVKTDAQGNGFDAAITLADPTTISAVVRGQFADCSRRVRLCFLAASANAPALNYGIASRSAIDMTGNTRILGKNNVAEANVLSATYTDLDAFDANGNCTIAGDISISNPAGQVSLTGNVSIGGQTSGGGHIQDHIHIGVGDMEFPTAAPSVFEPFATNIVDAQTSTNGNKTFTNIRIKANTNPTFSGNITLKGVIFIETPNAVTFTGNLNITGVVVTQPGVGGLNLNSIRFLGNTSVLGVESLPAGQGFDTLRQMPGTFLLAPGFAVDFTGNFGTVSGAMAADQFAFTGNAGGTVHGAVINWGDTSFTMTGNSSLTIDRSDPNQQFPGLSSPARLSALPRTYEEL